MKRSNWLTISIIALFLITAHVSMAAPPPGSTTAPYTISYSGKLTDSTQTPITTAQSIRFSIWTDADFDAGDLLGSGAIDIAAVGYAGWQETHTVTPDANGLFHVQLGSITTLPNFTNATHKFLQVDAKASALPDTSYEVLDPDGNTATLTDRHPLNSSAFTINADTVDNADVGTGPGNIPVLDGTGKLPISTIPGGTNADSFVLDFDDTVVAGSVNLQFGTTLARILSYNSVAGWFNFNDDVNIMGNLTVTGNANFSASAQFHMREVANEAAATCTTLNEMVLDTTEDIIYVCTAIGAPGTWVASIGASASANNDVLEFFPEYPNTVIFPDGTTNTGTLSSDYDDANNEHFYDWRTGSGALQDMDVRFRFPLPADFVSTGDFTFRYRTGTAVAGDNRVDITVSNATNLTAGAPTTCGSSTSNTTANVWATGTITAATIAAGCTGATALSAGDIIQITVRLFDNSGAADFAQIGHLTLAYNN